MLSGTQWQCANKHSYDQAKAGYVNLLLANQKSRPEPGDNKAMMRARRAFLEADHYLPLVNTLVDLITRHAQAPSLRIHDAGCGEGYYLSHIVTLLEKSGCVVQATGNDISRAAIEMAAKKYPGMQFAIAGNYKLPLADASQDVLLHVFAPALATEAHRVLVSGGHWIRVTPAPAHLSQLREALYETPTAHSTEELVPAGFELLQQSRLQFDLQLPAVQARQELLMMTPYYWRVEAAALDGVLAQMAAISADFCIQVLCKQ